MFKFFKQEEKPKTLIDPRWEEKRIEDLYGRIIAIEYYLGINLYKKEGYQVRKLREIAGCCSAQELPGTLNK
jgi:hypothetical protein